MRENVEAGAWDRRQIDACCHVKELGPRSGPPASVDTPVLDMIFQAKDRLVHQETGTCSTLGTGSPALHASKEQPANGRIPAAASATSLPVAATPKDHEPKDRIAFELPSVDIATLMWPDEGGSIPDAAMTKDKTSRDRALSSAEREERLFCCFDCSSPSVQGINGSLLKDVCVLWSEISSSVIAAPALAAGGINRGVQSLPLPGHGAMKYADQRRSNPADKDSHTK